METTNNNNLADEIILLKSRLLDALDNHQKDKAHFHEIIQAIALAVDPESKSVNLGELVEKIHSKFAEDKAE